MLHGIALLNMKKREEAVCCWNEGLKCCLTSDRILDACLLQDLQDHCDRYGSLTTLSLQHPFETTITSDSDSTSHESVECCSAQSCCIANQQPVIRNDCKKESDVIVPESSLPVSSNVTLEMLLYIHSQFIGVGSHQISRTYIDAVRKQTSFMCGDNDIVDDLTALAYLNINTGNYDLALQLFVMLIQYLEHSKVGGKVQKPSVAMYLGLGSALAMSKRFEEAIEAFSSAIALEPGNMDSWKRRGQTRVANGNVDGGLSDFS